MKKLKLDVESLAVESFEATTDGVGTRGTVEGQNVSITINTVVIIAITDYYSCWDYCIVYAE